MPTVKTELSDQQVEFIRQRLGQGEFHSVEDMLRTGLQLLEMAETDDRLREARLGVLVKEGFDGIGRGDLVSVTDQTLDQFMDSVSATSRTPSGQGSGIE